jgi:iron complex transport system substrate-binding protein
MNRIIRVLLNISILFLISFSLFAGGNSENSSAASTAQPVAQSESEASPYPMTVTDGLGTQMVIGAQPESIASLTLFTDEVLIDLLEPGMLAAVTFLSTDDTYSNVVDQAALVPVQMELNVEQLIDLYPDIIFTANWSDAGKIDQLRQAGLTVYAVNTPFTMEGIQQEILTLGRVLNRREAAEDLVAGMRERLAELESLVSDGVASGIIRPLSAIDYSNWDSASGVDTTWQALLEAAGVGNAAAALESGDFGQVPISKEALVEIDPDVLVLPGFIWGDPQGAENFLSEVVEDPALSGVTAIREDRVFLMPERLKSTYSQYIVDGAFFIARQVYPEVFPE